MSTDPQAIAQLRNKLIEEREYLDQLQNMPDIIPKALEYCQVIISAIDFVLSNDTQPYPQQCQISFLLTAIWSIKRYLGSLQRQDMVLHVLFIYTCSLVNTTPSIPDELHDYVARIGEIAEEYVNEVRNARSARTSTDEPTPTANLDNTISQGLATVHPGNPCNNVQFQPIMNSPQQIMTTCELIIPPGGNVHPEHDTVSHSHVDTNVPTQPARNVENTTNNSSTGNEPTQALGQGHGKNLTVRTRDEERANTPRDGIITDASNATNEIFGKRSPAECSGREEKRARKE